MMFMSSKCNHRIQKFDSNGNFITKWDGGEGQFNGPKGIAVDSSGNVYATDSGNNRIQKFNNGGGFITQWVHLLTKKGSLKIHIE